nr:3-deoxy-7-phosphoheptulonate synthase [Lachnospiraceae bacterium]
RGTTNKHGNNLPNYHYEDLELLCEKYAERDLVNPACIVDTNHSNSNKKYMEQIRISKEVMHSRNHNPEIKKLVKGLMIESYIEPGNQKISDHMVYGKSITDPCLGWEDTERLILDLADLV